MYDLRSFSSIGMLTVGEVTRGLCKLTGISPYSVMAMVVPKDVEFYLSELNQKSPQKNYGRSWFNPNTESYKLLKYTSHDMRVQDGVYHTYNTYI